MKVSDESKANGLYLSNRIVSGFWIKISNFINSFCTSEVTPVYYINLMYEGCTKSLNLTIHVFSAFNIFWLDQHVG